MRSSEEAVVFRCGDAQLIGIVHKPDQPKSRGVVIVVGGPQYRVGSHRQFVLMARHLAEAGFPVFRFDYRGMGDSSGPAIDFEQCGPDIEAAVRTFRESMPGIADIVLLGLCDAASAILMSTTNIGDLGGIVLINPWVRTEQGLARVQMRHHYARQLLDRQFWWRLVTGRVRIGQALLDAGRNVLRLRSGKGKSADGGQPSAERRRSFPERMLEGLASFGGHILLVLSGDDLTAREFSDLVKTSKGWQRCFNGPQVTRLELPNANHTFSKRDWRQRVFDGCSNWLESW